MECPICCERQPLLYSIANCPHRFCLNCSMYHINTKAELFTDILCPHQNCKQPFNKNPEIMNRLLQKTIHNIEKIDRFAYISSHPELKPCSIINCQGVFNIKQSKKVCDICGAAHCPKCLKVFHSDPCVLDQNDASMKSLAYQKCPNCSIWVDKKEGCNYIDCKCGTTFCYTCGVKFEQDPCRLGQIWNSEFEIRKLLLSFKYRLPEQKKYYLLLIIKFPLQILAFLFFTIFFSIISMTLIILIMGLLIGFSPLIIIGIICAIKNRFAIVVVLIFLPLATALTIILILFILFSYPFTRKSNHHGLYDEFDITVYTVTKLYLKGVLCIFN